jgi:peptidyl-tRNA hydrolase, PTH1 family
MHWPSRCEEFSHLLTAVRDNGGLNPEPRAVPTVKLVVGLGNPGRKYEGTRHNVGFAVLHELARRQRAARPKTNFQGEITEADLNGCKTLLLWPHTFMNLSGASVLAARDFYKLEAAQVLIVCDDFNLPLGKLRLRSEGSAGGQKGLADVIERFGTEAVPRLRIGVGPVPPQWDPADFVLARFAKDELPVIKSTLARAADAVADWVSGDIQSCMNKYNG